MGGLHHGIAILARGIERKPEMQNNELLRVIAKERAELNRRENEIRAQMEHASKATNFPADAYEGANAGSGALRGTDCDYKQAPYQAAAILHQTIERRAFENEALKVLANALDGAEKMGTPGDALYTAIATLRNLRA